MPDSFAESAEGVILAANGIDPMVRWDGYSEQADPAGVEPPDQDITPVIAGSGGGGLTGTYAAYARFVDKNGNVSNLSPISNTITVTSAGQFDYSNLPTPVQATVTRRQILRNTDGQFDTFYVAVDSTDIYSTTASDSFNDATLASQEAVPLLDATGLPFANGFAPPPDTKPFLCAHIDRMWAAGEQPFAEGSIAVTKGSTTVTGYGTRWPGTWPGSGRFLYVQGATRSYQIDTVDEPNQTLVLLEAYEDDTDPFAAYSIKPAPADAESLYFTPAGLPEAWPAFNGFTLPQDGDHVTGLCNYSSFLWIFKKRKTYRMTAQSDPAHDGFIFYAIGRGCINHRCWVIVEESLYLLDEGGVYRTSGGDEVEQLSTAIQNLFRRDVAGAINWTASRYFHCCFSPAEETIRWFVTMYGEYLPRHAICLHHKTGKWWIEAYPIPVASSCLGRVGRPTGGWGDGGEQMYLGGPAGAVLISGGGLDGVAGDGPLTRFSPSSAGSDSVTNSGGGFDSSWANVPVAILAGRGKGQSRVVVSATTTKLTVDEPWAVKPDTTSVLQVGGIDYRYTGGRLRFAPTEQQDGRSVELQYQPTLKPQTADLRFVQDFRVVPRPMGRDVGQGVRAGVAAAKGGQDYALDLSRTSGHYWMRIDGHREQGSEGPRLLRVEIEGVSGPEPVVFGEMVINGVVG